MSAMGNKNKFLDRMAAFRRANDAQGAAELIAQQTGVAMNDAMDAARNVGFVPEFYANAIRVHLMSAYRPQ
jgi:hypothetical protein